MRVAPHRQEAGITAHILAQLLDSSILDGDAAAGFHAVMRAEGRDMAAMLRDGEQIPLRWFLEVYPHLDTQQAATMGYAAGEQARITSYTPLSLPLISAPTIHEVVRMLAFLPLITNSLSARCIERADDVAIVLTATSGDPALDRFIVFYGAAAFVRLLSLLSTDATDFTFHIAWPPPAGFAQQSECVAGRLRFDAPLHHIVVPRTTLQAACLFADPIAHRAALAALQARLDTLGFADNIINRLRQLLDSHRGLVAIDDAARLLCMSVSTLKRRLADRNTSFRALRESASRERALLLLADKSLSLESIANALGYSDRANFSHAFKRWTGMAPGAFRRHAWGSSASAEDAHTRH